MQSSGLILLAFIAALVTFGFTRLRRRIGMGVTSRTWGMTFGITIIVILALWAAGHS